MLKTLSTTRQESKNLTLVHSFRPVSNFLRSCIFVSRKKRRSHWIL